MIVIKNYHGISSYTKAFHHTNARSPHSTDQSAIGTICRVQTVDVTAELQNEVYGELSGFIAGIVWIRVKYEIYCDMFPCDVRLKNSGALGP